MITLRPAIRMLRPAISKSWALARLYYRWHGLHLAGRPEDEVWYFAFGANMHDSAFRERRAMQPIEWRPGRVKGYRLRFNLEGRPRGKAAPANISPDPDAEIWGVLYRIRKAFRAGGIDTCGPMPRTSMARACASSPTSQMARSRMATHPCVTSPCFARGRGHTACPKPICGFSIASNTRSDGVLKATQTRRMAACGRSRVR